MLTSRVRQFLEMLDGQFVQDGQLACASLEAALNDARTRGDDAQVAEHALQMGIRLVGTATVSRALARRTGESRAFPTADDVLEPAIELLWQSLAATRRVGNASRVSFVQCRLADAYLQANQFAKASAEFGEVAQRCVLPRDVWLYFEATQKSGDCDIQLENDAGALLWYQRAMDAARQIDDPFEIQVQHGKLACALGNLKRYDEALHHLREARHLLVRIGAEPELQSGIIIHRHSFNLAALPALVEYVDDRIAHARDGLGRELLRELPRHIGGQAVAMLTERKVAPPFEWVVQRELLTATRSASEVLEDILGLEDIEAHFEPVPDAAPAVLKRVGSLARRHFEVDLPDPTDLAQAARQLVHVDRSRRAALLAREAKDTTVGAGPDFGPGSKHVVYLRSFVASAHLPTCHVAPWGSVDLEELLACLLDRSPVIALGNPDFERFGPGRVRTSDENWRDVLRGLALSAQMLIVIPAVTGGTCWELEWVTTNKLLHKTCFVMPPATGQDAAWWESNWTELKHWAVRLGVGVPTYSAAGAVFRLSSEGMVEEMDYRALYDPSDLHMTLLSGLLFRFNPSYDFIYAAQKTLGTAERSEAKRAGEALTGPEASQETSDAQRQDGLDILAQLEVGERYEMSSWWFESQVVPNRPGLLLIYEGPFQLLWVQDCADLNGMLKQVADGRACNFTRALFHVRMLPNLQNAQAQQLLDQTLGIEDLVRVRVKLTLSYRYITVPDAEERALAASRAWEGALRAGVPKLPRVVADAQRV